MSIGRSLLAFVLLMSIVQCGGNDYGVAIRNMTGGDIEAAHVSFDGFRSVGGGIEPGFYVIHLYVEKRIPEVATVEWKTPAGLSMTRTVEVRKLVPAQFNKIIFFDIMPDGSVNVVPRIELPATPAPPSDEAR